MITKRMTAIMAVALMSVIQLGSLAFAERLELDRTINKRGEDLSSTYLESIGDCYISPTGYYAYYFCYDIETVHRGKEYDNQVATLESPFGDGEIEVVSKKFHVSHEDHATRPRCFGPAYTNNVAQARVYRDECVAATKSARRLKASSNRESTRQKTNREARR